MVLADHVSDVMFARISSLSESLVLIENGSQETRLERQRERERENI
jgi:hypothetical protein